MDKFKWKNVQKFEHALSFKALAIDKIFQMWLKNIFAEKSVNHSGIQIPTVGLEGKQPDHHYQINYLLFGWYKSTDHMKHWILVSV